jgi:hypothetical protein
MKEKDIKNRPISMANVQQMVEYEFERILNIADGDIEQARSDAKVSVMNILGTVLGYANTEIREMHERCQQIIKDVFNRKEDSN